MCVNNDWIVDSLLNAIDDDVDRVAVSVLTLLVGISIHLHTLQRNYWESLELIQILASRVYVNVTLN